MTRLAPCTWRGRPVRRKGSGEVARSETSFCIGSARKSFIAAAGLQEPVVTRPVSNSYPQQVCPLAVWRSPSLLDPGLTSCNASNSKKPLSKSAGLVNATFQGTITGNTPGARLACFCLSLYIADYVHSSKRIIVVCDTLSKRLTNEVVIVYKSIEL